MTDFRNIRLVNPVGQQAASGFMQDVSNQMLKLGQKAEQISLQRLEQAGKQTAIQEKAGLNNLQKGGTAEALAFNKGFLSSYAAKLDMQSTAQFEKMRSEYGANVEGENGLANAIESYIQDTLNTVDPSLHVSLDPMLRKKAAPILSKARNEAFTQQRTLEKQSLLASAELNFRKAQELSLGKSEEEVHAHDLHLTMANGAFDSLVESGHFSKEEMELKRQKLTDKLQETTILQAIQKEKDPMNFALALSENNGIKPEIRQKLLSHAVQIDSAKQTIKKRSEAVLKKMTDAHFAEGANVVYTQPHSIQSASVIEQLREIADSPEEVKFVQNLEEFRLNAHEDKYRVSEPQIIQQIERSLIDGRLTFDDLAEKHGNGLSTNDFKQYIEEMKAVEESLVSSEPMRLFKEQLEAEFPTEKLSPMELLMMNESQKAAYFDSDGFLKSEKNRRLIDFELINMKQRVLDGDFNNSYELRDELQTIINKLRQTHGGQSTLGHAGKQTNYTQGQQFAMRDQQAVTVAAKYKGDLDKLKEDIRSGALDRTLGRKAFNIIRAEEAQNGN